MAVTYPYPKVASNGKLTVQSDGMAVNTTQVLQAVYPVGSVFLATVSTNPSTLLGFGTWSKIQGYIVGTSSTSTVPLQTQGSNTRTLTTANMPSHTHTITVASGGAHAHSASGSQAAHSHTITVNSGGSHNHTATTSGVNLSHYHVPDNNGSPAYQFALFCEANQSTNPHTGACTDLYYAMRWGGAQTESALGSHTHTVTVNSGGAHSHTASSNSQTPAVTVKVAEGGGHSHTASAASVGSGTAFDIQPQHFEVFAWRRTA